MPTDLATLAQSAASPQWTPSYQLLKVKPLRWPSRCATHDVHWPWKKPSPSFTQPPVPTVDSSQSGAAGQG